MKAMPEFQDVTSDLQIKNPQLNVEIRRDQAHALHVTAEQIETALYDAYGSRQVSTILSPNNQYQVILEVEPQFQMDTGALSMLYVRASTGQLVPLKAVAGLTEGVVEAIKRYQDLEVVSVLLRNGAEVNVKDEEDNTPLHLLAEKGSSLDKKIPDTIKILLEHGADVNAQNYKGFTPLMHAVKRNRAENVELLLRAGADVTIKNNMKQTAMDYARRPGNEAIMNLLQGYEADAKNKAIEGGVNNAHQR